MCEWGEVRWEGGRHRPHNTGMKAKVRCYMEFGFYSNCSGKLPDFKSGSDYIYIDFIFRSWREKHQRVNRDHQWVGEGHEPFVFVSVCPSVIPKLL